MRSRESYLEELKRQLRVRARTRNELLADIQNHILDGIAAGETEAEVVARLGDPKELARAFNRSAPATVSRQAMTIAATVAVAGGVILQQQPAGTEEPASAPPTASTSVIAIDPQDRSVVYVGGTRPASRAES